MNILVYGIEWDTEGETREECELPEQILVLDVAQPTADEDMEENLGERISEAFGFTHYAFSWEEFSKVLKTHAGGGHYPPKNLAVI